MAQEKSKSKLILYGLLITVLLFGLIIMVFNQGKLFLKLELMGVSFLLLLTLIGLVSYRTAYGERIFFFVFLCYIINIILIWSFFHSLYFILLLLSVLGFIISLPKPFPKHQRASQEPKSKVPEPLEKPKEGVGVKEQEKAGTTFIPGKYVASKRSNVYHAPKCDWAKKIRKERQVWFKDKEEAWEKGYKAHDCVQ